MNFGSKGLAEDSAERVTFECIEVGFGSGVTRGVSGLIMRGVSDLRMRGTSDLVVTGVSSEREETGVVSDLVALGLKWISIRSGRLWSATNLKSRSIEPSII